MKKIKSVVLMSILSLVMVLSLVGCGNNAIVGKWTLTEGRAQGLTIDMATMKEMMGLETDMTFEFQKDGTFVGDFMGEIAEGTWKEEDKQYTLTVDGEDIFATIEEGKLLMDASGATLVLEK